MKTIKIKKFDGQMLQVLQNAISTFLVDENRAIKSVVDNKYFEILLKIDIATKLYYYLRSQIEKNKSTASISFSVSEAVILLQCCLSCAGDDYENNTLRRFADIIHKSLVDLNLNTQSKPLEVTNSSCKN